MQSQQSQQQVGRQKQGRCLTEQRLEDSRQRMGWPVEVVESQRERVRAEWWRGRGLLGSEERRQ